MKREKMGLTECDSITATAEAKYNKNKPSLMVGKLPIIALILLLSLPPVLGYGLVSTQGNVTMRNPAYNITLIPTLNLTSMSSDGTILTINVNASAFTLNSSADFKISNIKYNTTIDERNFTINATNGVLDSTMSVTQFNKNYLFYINNIYNTTYTSANNNVTLKWSNWSINLINFSLILNPAYNNNIPTFTSLTLIPSTKKNNQTININASGITDDSTSWQLQTYWKNGSTNVYIANSSWVNTSFINITGTVPFTTGGAHIIYAVIYDSGNVTGQSNLTSGESQQTFTSLITDPTIESSSLSASSITVGGTVTITAQFNGQGANISSATVNVERPDATIANWTMTCDSGEIVNCTKSYTSTSDIGTYYIRYFYPTDNAGITATISSVLTFTAAAATTSSGGGGGGGGVVYINPTPSMTPSVNLTLIGITDGARSISDVEAINRCLTGSFFLSNECTSSTIISLKSQTNWYTMLGAYLSSIFTIFGLNLIIKKKRSYFDSLIYGTIVIISALGMNLVGFNFVFLWNYVLNNSLSAFTFFSFMTWGFVGTVFMEEYISKKDRIWQVRKINI